MTASNLTVSFENFEEEGPLRRLGKKAPPVGTFQLNITPPGTPTRGNTKSTTLIPESPGHHWETVFSPPILSAIHEPRKESRTNNGFREPPEIPHLGKPATVNERPLRTAPGSAALRTLPATPVLVVHCQRPEENLLSHWWGTGEEKGPIRRYLYFDGGSRGNPGPAGCGTVLRSEEGEANPETVLWQKAHFVGRWATNNQAEYQGLLEGLRFLVADSRSSHLPYLMDVTHLTILGDSQLVINQMTGKYQVNHPRLQPLAEEAQQLLMELRQHWPALVINFRHIYREKNRCADALANEAMNRGTALP